tara:strand:+ start:898 stop:1035 length:138 start_codon:yes stop_codon:yes gene_type:complete
MGVKMKDSKVKIDWIGALIWLLLIPGIGIFFWIQVYKLFEWLFGG